MENQSGSGKPKRPRGGDKTQTMARKVFLGMGERSDIGKLKKIPDDAKPTIEVRKARYYRDVEEAFATGRITRQVRDNWYTKIERMARTYALLMLAYENLTTKDVDGNYPKVTEERMNRFLDAEDKVSAFENELQQVLGNDPLYEAKIADLKAKAVPTVVSVTFHGALDKERLVSKNAKGDG